MTNNTTTTPAGATLTQKELFQRFLDAPFYEGGNLSTLVDSQRVSERTVQENFHYCAGLASGHWPDLGYGWSGMHEFLLEHLRESDNPEFDLEEIVGDVAGMLRDFQNLKRGFDAVCAVTRVDAPDEDAPDEVHRDWEDNSRYVLPDFEEMERETRRKITAHFEAKRNALKGAVANANDMQNHLREMTSAVLKLSREGKI